MSRKDDSKAGVFSAILRYFRQKRGLSQLDLSLAADVSARHLSFLETGRAKPSDEMVLRLGSTLGLCMRDHNRLLASAGFEPLFPEPELSVVWSSPTAEVVSRMLRQHEPYPMVVLDGRYNVVRTNQGGERVLGALLCEPSDQPLNAFRVLFDPQGIRPFVQDWERVARAMLSRLQVLVLSRPHDSGLSELLEELLGYPDLPLDWQTPDFGLADQPTQNFSVVRGDLKLSFVTAVTRFSAPSNITVEELSIESYFPLDDATDAACRRLSAGSVDVKAAGDLDGE